MNTSVRARTHTHMHTHKHTCTQPPLMMVHDGSFQRQGYVTGKRQSVVNVRIRRL